jgi:hypothetical protein
MARRSWKKSPNYACPTFSKDEATKFAIVTGNDCDPRDQRWHLPRVGPMVAQYVTLCTHLVYPYLINHLRVMGGA